jgi:pilus assembly protein CpaC
VTRPIRLRSKLGRTSFSTVAALFVAGALANSVRAEGSAATGRGSSADASATPFETLKLAVGGQLTLPTENVKSYSEGVRGIVDVRMTKDASQFIIVALARGTTTLLLLMLDGTERYYRIEVGEPETRQQRRDGSVGVRDNIRLDFYFVQLAKSYGHNLGFGWPASIAPSFSAVYDVKNGQLASATAVISNQALPRLDMAQASGWAKVMRQAAVVTANGEKASLTGGGEVNIPVQTAMAIGVEKVQFGSQIAVEPLYDVQSGRIELRLRADIAELDDDHGTGLPGRLTSGLETVVNLELGQSLVLGGLTAKSERTTKAGVPGLSQIPLLGLLFGSVTRAESESENVVVIVPSVVDSVSMQSRERLEEALGAFTEYSGNIDDVKLVPSAPRPAAPGRRR